MKFDSKQLREMSGSVKAAALRAVVDAKSGHVGIVLGASDVVTTIFANHLRHGTDEFVLSAGHGSAMLYSVLKLAGYKIPDLDTFRKYDGLPGHPEYGIDGVAATTGPLGQGVGNAVGYALAKKIQNKDGRVYCLCSDGDLMEGVAGESIAFAGRHKLNNLILLWDDNGISIDGVAQTDLDIPARMIAAGFQVFAVDGHDFADINYAIDLAQKSSYPTFIRCRTTIGAGSSAAGMAVAHGLELPANDGGILAEQLSSAAGKKLWARIASKHKEIAPNKFPKRNYHLDDTPRDTVASTRDLSGKIIGELLGQEPLLVGGSADLATNVKVRVNSHRDITAIDFGGNFINYGVREHAMGAIMNGLTMSGLRAYGGTFLVFSDYMRAAIRLAALSGIPTIFVFSHDSVAVGEDGPTHQPVEQLGSLRLIPNINVLRPCNMEEVAWSWKTALAAHDRPSAIILSRQKFEQIKTPDTSKIERGGYIIRSANTVKPRVTLIATGSEVPLAVAVAEKLGRAVQVVSMPSVEIFRGQPDDYKKKILAGHVVAIEAGSSAPWFEFADAVVGLDRFGASGPGGEVYKNLGFDADAIANDISKKVK